MGPLTRPSPSFWSARRVFLTGHTGFKGGWLATWLHELGAVTAGYALPPDSSPNLFTEARIATLLEHTTGDIRDQPALTRAIKNFAPDIVLHLAAQPLVRAAHADPVATFATNILGTAHLLEAVSATPSARVTLIVTSDKVYAETPRRHTESARLGGGEPYSASKACAELVTASFPMPPTHSLATLRSGNVIGGGDWAADRLLPDFFRAILAGQPLKLRNPHAIRPWQHVLDPLCGYLIAAEHLWSQPPRRESWNFGPGEASEVPVSAIAAKLCALWGNGARHETESAAGAPHEAPILRLSSAKAEAELAWRPGWDLDQSLAATAAWYRRHHAGADMAAFTKSQIKAYCTP